MLDTLLRAFGKIIGSGRAWALQINPIRDILKSLLSINTETKEQFGRVLLQAFPDLCDESLIPLWEEALGISPGVGQTISERRAAIFSKWISVGGQARGYIQNVLESFFPDIDVVEDLRLANGGTIIQENLIDNYDIESFPLFPWISIGTSVIEKSTYSHLGNYCLYCTNISGSESGAGQNITRYNINGNDLTFDMWVKVVGDPSVFNISLKNSYVDKADETINLVSLSNPTPNTWVNITGIVNVEWDGLIDQSEIIFYTDVNQTGGGYPSFFLDDVKIEYDVFQDSILYDGSYFSNGQLIIDADTGETKDPITDPITAKQQSKVFKIQDASGFPLVINYQEKITLDALLLTIKPSQKIVNQRIAVLVDKTEKYFGFDSNPDAAGFGAYATENILDHNSLPILDHNSLPIESIIAGDVDPGVGGKFVSQFVNDRREIQ